jgi:hypothetical protein
MCVFLVLPFLYGLRRSLCRCAVTWLNMLVAMTLRPMLVIMPWLLLSMGIPSETIIAYGVLTPIRMASFPSMKTLQPNGITC